MEVVFGPLVLATKRVEAYEEVLASIDNARSMHTYLPETLWPGAASPATSHNDAAALIPEEGPRPSIADAIEAKKGEIRIE